MSVVAETRPEAGVRKSSFRPDIQGLRAIAVLLVVLYHSGVDLLSGGYVGVDVFFVISGFLITTHLVESLEQHGRISFGQFYARRARRILPAALLVAVLTVLAAWVWMPPLLMREVLSGAVATALYVPNILFSINGTNYLAETAPSVFQHYWSLGIEEQFYLVWPAILALSFWLCRRNAQRVIGVVAILTIASFALCVIGMHLSETWTFFSLPTRAWELGVGGLTAFVVRSRARWLYSAGTGLLAWVGLIALIAVALQFDSLTPFPGYHALLPVVATVLLIIGGNAPNRLNANRLLSLSPFQFFGLISYSLYLVHWPLQVIPQAAAGADEPLSIGIRLLLGVVGVPLAWLVYRFVERPVIALPGISQRRPLWSGVAAVASSLIVILIAGGSYLGSSMTTLSDERSASQVSHTVNPTGTAYVPANISPDLRGASSDIPITYANGCHRDYGTTDASGCQVGANPEAPVVFLFGDSHAASWYPAFEELANRGLIRLDVNTKSSCHSISVAQVLNGVEYTECDLWRRGVIERIGSNPPELVVLANYSNENSQLVGGNHDFASRWRAALKDTIDSMPETDVVVLADVPDQGSTPAICLSANLGDANECAVARSEAFSSVVTEAERSATRASQATYLDLSQYFCNDTLCPPIIGDTLVYRDGHHLTERFSRKMAVPLWESLNGALS